METPILELARRARAVGLDIQLTEPLPTIPDVRASIGLAIDPQLQALYRVTNGLCVGRFDILPIRRGSGSDLEEVNDELRDILNYLPFVREVLVWGSHTTNLTTLACMPALADQQGRQPVIFLNANEGPYITPLSSTFNRALTLIMEDRIQEGPVYDEWREAFPYVMVDDVIEDARLMQMIDAGAFHDLGVDVEEEWLDMLREAR